jgi:thiol-disulfide isomerase/thioredoxin
MNSSRPLRLFLLASIALLAILAACGDDESSEGAGELEHDFAFIPYQSIGDPESGDEMMFSELFEDGNPVVLNFWAGQCPPCRAEMPYFQALADEYSEEFTLIGIDVGVFTGLGTEQNALDLLEELNITYPAGRAVDREPLLDYSATGMPTTIFFNGDGEVVDKRIGLILEDEMRRKLDELI